MAIRQALDAGEDPPPPRSLPLILVADDDPTLRLLARDFLEQEGFQIEEATDGSQAIALFHKVRPDVLLLDVNMPNRDGNTVCAILRRTPEAASVPVVMMTASGDDASIRQAYEAGATDFIPKPVNWVLLAHRVRYLLRASRAHDRLLLDASRLAHAQRIVHGFNNLLTIILARSELLLLRLPDASPVRRDIRAIQAAAEKASHLAFQLLVGSRKQVLERRPLDLNAVVDDLHGLIRQAIGERVECRLALAPDLGWVNADRGQIEEVLLSLVVNARDAMPEGGRLTIRTGNVRLEPAFLRGHAGARPGPYVMLAVEDSGVGMDEKARARIFEPGFTTEALGKRTGLGLAAAYGIVNQQDGLILLESQPGWGSAFTVYLEQIDKPEDPGEVGGGLPAYRRR